MWSISAQDVIHLGRTPGGERFTELVNEVLRAQAYVCGIPQASIHTSLRTNYPDGQVDARVDEPIANSLGWMTKPTIWQYKAMSAAEAFKKIASELKSGSYAEQCIKDGFAYRYCVCDDPTSHDKVTREAELAMKIASINPKAPAPRILGAGDVAAWVSHFPALILRFFRGQLTGGPLHIRAWGDTILSGTRIFVPVAAWQPVQERLHRHLDFSELPADIVFPLQGVAGVGKTRMVYEVLTSRPDLSNLVLYIDDEGVAVSIARELVNDPSQRAVLVADECSVKSRVHLGHLLRNAGERVRVITIDNAGERPSSGSLVSVLEVIPAETVDTILGTNYPHIPQDRRRAYASLSGGFLRFASDLCNHDARIAVSGNIEPASQGIRDYIRNRFQESDLVALEALSLLTTVGFRDDVAGQIKQLGALVGLEPRHLQEAAQRLHDTCGFVGRGGRYFYVTPEIIAQSCFEAAWRRWAEFDPDGFLARIPSALTEAFGARVALSAPEEVRSRVGSFFRGWIRQLRPEDLRSLETVDQLISLVETSPEQFFPMTGALIEDSALDQLRAMRGEGVGGRWGPRRQLVWLAERMAAFPEQFVRAERILLRLALSENEEGTANNATAIWKQLYRVVLSGTANPFMERLERLRGRILNGTEAESSLAMQALGGLFGPDAMRVLGPAVIAGRIPPPEWNPATRLDYGECLDASMDLLCELAQGENQRLSSEAQVIALEHLARLLELGYLEEVAGMFPPAELTDELRVQLINKVTRHLSYMKRREPEDEHTARVEEWLHSLRPADVHGRIVAAVGVDAWRRGGPKEEAGWMQELQHLAQLLLAEPETLQRELPAILAPQAGSAYALGERLGEEDRKAILLERLMDASLQSKSSAFTRGYVAGLLKSVPEQAGRINRILDDVQELEPNLAYQVFTVGGNVTKAVERTVQLVDTGKLSARYLQTFILRVDDQPLSREQFSQVLERLLDGIHQGDTALAEPALELVQFRIEQDKKEAKPGVMGDPVIRELIWSLLDTAGTAPGSSYWWGEILNALRVQDPSRAAEVAVGGLLGEGSSVEGDAVGVLVELASTIPDGVMQSFGRALIDPEMGWRLRLGNHHSLIASLPSEVVMNWAREHGVEGARAVARHLPRPYIGPGGKPELHPVTRALLSEFEDDEIVFAEFYAGTHGMRLYVGDIAAQHEQEAELARQFLDHPLRQLRHWAKAEVERAKRQADWWRQQQEEMGLP